MELTEGLALRGRVELTVVRPSGSIREHVVQPNVICTNGFSALAAALVWSGIQDQASALGVTSPTYLTPLWGAVGSGGGSPAKSDTQLFAELGRETVGAGASTPATGSVAAECTWLFYFPPPPSTWTVTEAGVFANATATTNAGTLINHSSVSATVPTSDTLILQVSLALGP